MSVAYEGPESYQKVFDSTLGFIDENIDYYQYRIKWRRRMSWVVRGLVLVTLIVGILLPIYAAGLPEDPSGPSKFQLSMFGYYVIVLGGLIFAIDQTFLITKSWMRFTVTMISLQDVKKDFVDSWDQSFHKAAEKSEENFKAALTLGSEYKDKAQILVEQETNQWVQDLTAAMTSLEQRIAKQEKKLESKFETMMKERNAAQEAQVQSAQLGAILVKFQKPDIYQGDMAVSLDGPDAKTATIPAGTAKHAFGKLRQGVYTVTLQSRQKDAQGQPRDVSDSDVVTLAAGGKAEVSF